MSGQLVCLNLGFKQKGLCRKCEALGPTYHGPEFIFTFLPQSTLSEEVRK